MLDTFFQCWKLGMFFSLLYTFTSCTSHADVISNSDTDIVEAILNRANSDLNNLLNGNALRSPAAVMSFPSVTGVYTPPQKCVRSLVVDDAVETLNKYDCPQMEGEVRYSGKSKNQSVKTETEVDLITADKTVHSIKASHSTLQDKNGGLQLKAEFQDLFAKDGGEYLLSGSANYELSKEAAKAQPSIVMMNGTLKYHKNKIIQSTQKISSLGLRRSACGFDKGSIEIKSKERTLTVTFQGCGKREVAIVR